MKSVLATVLFLFGLVLAVESKCNISSCTAPTTQSCSTVTTYLNCLTQQISGCGSDSTTKAIMESTVKTLQQAIASLGCSGGGGSGASGGGAMVTISILVFSLLAFYLKF